MEIEVIRNILDSRDFERFVGQIEHQHFECKLVCRADALVHKRELAKDISGMANAGGGFIVVGLATESLDDRPDDKVTKVAPLRPQDFAAGVFRDTLKTWVYPPIEGLQIEWVASVDDPERVIHWTRIPV